MDQSKRVAGAAAMFLGCGFVVSSALAAGADPQVRTEDIKFQDLNLDTTAGVEALYQRIHAAAERVCAHPAEPKLGAASASEKCTNGAAARAIKDVNVPALTAFAANRSAS
jgi:UrcA family protein